MFEAAETAAVHEEGVICHNMKLVVVDGNTLNPGDLSWDALDRFGAVEVYANTAYDSHSIVERVGGAEIVITNKVPFDDNTLDQLLNLRYIGVAATGYNIIDIEAARRREVVVTNVPTYGTASVAQMTFAHILNVCHRVAEHAQTVRRGRWSECEDFCYWDYPLIELAGLTLGIVGLGRIGLATASIGRSFGMRVIAHDAFSGDRPEYIKAVELDELFEQSDVVSLHCPLTPETEKLVNRRRLERMKPTAMLINTGRGPLVDEAALAEALDRGQIAAAGLDVLCQEPPDAGNPLFKAKNCYITPHISWATKAARERLLASVVENVAGFVEGNPRNVVNPQRG